MYWPLNAPKVYAAHNGFRRANRGSAKSSAEASTLVGDDALARDSTIIGLEVARNGHLFATITAITLTIWQLAVGPSGLLLARSD